MGTSHTPPPLLTRAWDNAIRDVPFSLTGNAQFYRNIDYELQLHGVFQLHSRPRGYQHHEQSQGMVWTVTCSESQNAGDQPQNWLTYSLPIIFKQDLHREFELPRCGDGWIPDSKTVHLSPFLRPKNVVGFHRPFSVLCIWKMAQLDRAFCDELRKLRATPPHLRQIPVDSPVSDDQRPNLTSEPSVEDHDGKIKTTADDVELGQLVDQLFKLWPKGIKHFCALGAANQGRSATRVPNQSTNPQQEASLSTLDAQKSQKSVKQSKSGGKVRVKGKRQMMADGEIAVSWRCLHEACIAENDESCDGNLTIFTSMLRHMQGHNEMYQGRPFSYYLETVGKRHSKSDDQSCEILSAVLFRKMNPMQQIPYLRFQRLPNGKRQPLPLMATTLNYMSLGPNNQVNEHEYLSSIPRMTGQDFTAYSTEHQQAQGGTMMARFFSSPPLERSSRADQWDVMLVHDDNFHPHTEVTATTQNDMSEGSLPQWLSAVEHIVNQDQSTSNDFPNASHGIVTQGFNDVGNTASSGSLNEMSVLQDCTGSRVMSVASGGGQSMTARTIALETLRGDIQTQILLQSELMTANSAIDDEKHARRKIERDYEDSMQDLDRRAVEQNMDLETKKRERQKIDDQCRKDFDEARKHRLRIEKAAISKIKNQLPLNAETQPDTSTYHSSVSEDLLALKDDPVALYTHHLPAGN